MSISRAVLLPAAACSLLAVAITFLSTAAAQSQPPIPELDSPYLEINNKNYAAVAAAISSEHQQILVTTVLMHMSWVGHTSKELMLETFRNFAFMLARSKRLRNTLTLSYDAETCRVLIAEGMPCFVDRAAPQIDQLPGVHKSRAPTLQKYWHGLELTRLNYTVLVLDYDLSVIRDPFEFADPLYDIEGLSDWNGHSYMPGPEQLVDEGCQLYKMVQKKKDDKATMEFVWPKSEADYYSVVKHLDPCMSTGLFFLKPRLATVRFLEHMLDYLLVHHVWAWEQAVFNEIIMGHVIGGEEREPLIFRILPMRHFANVRVPDIRRRHNLPVDLVVLHAGGVGGTGKAWHLKQEGQWNPEDWQPSMGLPLIEELKLALPMFDSS